MPFNPPPHTPFQWMNSPSTPLDATHLMAAETDIVAYAQAAVQALDAARFLNPTGIKTSNYTLAAQDLAVGDATSQSLLFTLPTAPADGTTVGITLIATTVGNTLTYQAGGSDTLYAISSVTSDSISSALQGVVLQYSQATASWYLRSSAAGAATPGLQPVNQPASPYAANPNEFVIADTTTGPLIINLPAQPADATQASAVISVQGSDASGNPYGVVFNAGAGDAFLPITGTLGANNPTTEPLTLPGQPVTYQYSSATKLWITLQSAPVTAFNANALQANTPINVTSVRVAGVSGQTNPMTIYGYKNSAGAPTTGHWHVGDRVDAISGGTVSPQICTIAGTPGLWNGATGSAPTVTYPTGVTNLTTTGVTLNASIAPNTQETSYHFEYGTTTSYGTRLPLVDHGLGASDGGTYPVSVDLAGLTPATAYHWRLVAQNGSGITNGTDQTFTTINNAPLPIVTYPGTPTTNINNTSATINGLVNPNGVATTFSFEYGTTTSYGSSLPLTTGVNKVQISPLVSLATTLLTLTLPAAPTPNQNNVMVAYITTPNDAPTITPPNGWTLITQGVNGACAINAFYKVVQSGDTAAQTFTRPTSAAISGVMWEYSGVDTTKLVDAFAVNTGNSATITSANVTPTNTNAEALVGMVHVGPDVNWTASPTNSFAVEAGATGSKNEFLSLQTSATTAVSTSDTISGARAWVSLALVLEGYVGSPSVGSGTNPVAESVLLTGLTAGTTYHWRLNATNANGTTHGTDQTFNTTAAVTPPTIVVNAPTGITQTGVTLNGTVNPNNVASTTYQWVYGTSSAFGQVAPASPGSVTNGTTAIAVPATLTGLQPGTQYKYALKATNSGGTYQSATQTVTTSPSTSTTIFTLTPDPTGVSVPYYQGCHTSMGDNWNSLAQLAASDPTNPTGRNVFAFTESDGTTGLQANNTCSNQKNTAGRYATTILDSVPQFAPGAHFWISCGYFLPLHFPASVGHYSLNEFFGTPSGLPPFTLGVGFTNQLIIFGEDAYGQTGLNGFDYTYKNFGVRQLGVWHDFLFEFQINTIRVGDATALVKGGLASQNIPNNDGWFRCWHNVNNNASWTINTSTDQVTLGATVGPPYNLTSNPNYPTGAPAGAPAGAQGLNLLQPNTSANRGDYPQTGTSGNNGWWTFGYTDSQSLANNGGTITHYADRTKCGFQMSDVT